MKQLKKEVNYIELLTKVKFLEQNIKEAKKTKNKSKLETNLKEMLILLENNKEILKFSDKASLLMLKNIVKLSPNDRKRIIKEAHQKTNKKQ